MFYGRKHADKISSSDHFSCAYSLHFYSTDNETLRYGYIVVLACLFGAMDQPYLSNSTYNMLK